MNYLYKQAAKLFYAANKKLYIDAVIQGFQHDQFIFGCAAMQWLDWLISAAIPNNQT